MRIFLDLVMIDEIIRPFGETGGDLLKEIVLIQTFLLYHTEYGQVLKTCTKKLLIFLLRFFEISKTQLKLF